MLWNLPAELVLEVCKYLPFSDVEELAWTTRRIMQIIKRNLPIALEPKIPIHEIFINPYKQHGLRVTIYFNFTTGQSHSLYDISAVFRNKDERKTFEDLDKHTYKIYQTYYLYCIKNSGKSKLKRWRDFALENGLNYHWETNKMTPLPIHLLLSNAIVEHLGISSDYEEMPWSIIDELCAVRANIKEKSLTGYSLLLNLNDKEKFLKCQLFKQGTRSIVMKAPTFINELLNMEQFNQTNWNIYQLTSVDFDNLPSSSVKNLKVGGGFTKSLREFISNFFQSNPKLIEWNFLSIKTEDNNLEWRSMEDLFKDFRVIHYKTEDISNIQLKYQAVSDNWDIELHINVTQRIFNLKITPHKARHKSNNL